MNELARPGLSDLNGSTIVVGRDDEPRALSLHALDDVFTASDALAGRELFLRGLRGGKPPRLPCSRKRGCWRLPEDSDLPGISAWASF
ncbi:MAG: hypothetical protein AABP62_06625 [Planctomycetota bacterium]